MGHNPKHNKKSLKGKVSLPLLLLACGSFCVALYLWMVHDSEEPHHTAVSSNSNRHHRHRDDFAVKPTDDPVVISSGATRYDRHLTQSVCEYSKSVRILCVGDSITYGNGSHVNRKERDHEGNYPLTLSALLRSHCPQHIEFDVVNLGHSGRTMLDGFKMSYRNSSVYQQANRLAKSADIVIIMLGSNDSKSRHWRGRQPFEEALVSLVEHFSKLNAALKFVLMTPPPSFPNPLLWKKKKQLVVQGSIRPLILQQEIRHAVMSASERCGTDVVDLFGIMEELDVVREGMEVTSTGTVQHSAQRITEAIAGYSTFFHDGVHPSVHGHNMIAEAVAKALLQQK